MSDRPIVIDTDGIFRKLPLTSPLIIDTPKEDDHAVTLELLQQLIKEKQETADE
jgi:hypothetical protein